MRLSLPSRVPLVYLGVFAGLVFLLQQIDGTSIYFSVLSVLFILIAGVTFNEAGGLTTPSGGYVFFFAVLSLLLGLLVKIFLGEAGDSNLLQPKLTMQIYVGGMLAMLGSVMISRRFVRKPAFLANVTNTGNMQNAATGCLVLGGTLLILAHVVPNANGSIFSALSQVNRFPELAILLGVTYQLKKTGGRSSVNLTVMLATALIWVNGGILGYSKQALFTPPICWAMAAAAQRYRLTMSQIVGASIFFALMIRFMVPYAQYGRNQGGETLRDNIQISMRMLSNLEDVRQRFELQRAEETQTEAPAYFNKPQGFFDRLQMVYVDSMLFDATEKTGEFGLLPLKMDVFNLVPHFLWPNKPAILWGNVFAHEAGVDLPEDDETTGISFTPLGEAYHLAKWAGVFAVAPVIWILCFVLFDSLCGDVRESPWGLLAIIMFAHVAPEGMLGGLIYIMGYGAFSILFAALTASYVTPILGILISGPAGRNTFVKTRVQSLPRRVATMPEPEPSGL